MNPETETELIERVINDELAGDSFDTQVEELAYVRHLDSRELVDTEANRATWIAAREFYEGKSSVVVNNHYAGDNCEGQKSQEVVQMDDLLLRQQALSYAVQSSAGDNTSSLVARSKAFLNFLQTGEKE